MGKYKITARINGRADVPVENDQYSAQNLPIEDIPFVDIADISKNNHAVSSESVREYIALNTSSFALKSFVEQHEITSEIFLNKKIILQYEPHDISAVTCELFSGSPQVNKKSFSTGVIVPNFEIDENEKKWFYFRNAIEGEHITNEEHSGLNEIEEGQFIRITYQYRV